MCIVIDTNTMSMVFSTENVRHHEFSAVKSWIFDGDGILVFGGTTYKKELGRAPKFLKIFLELRKAGKSIAIHDEIVDSIEADVKNKTSGTDCDDQHIVALIGASRCPVLCSTDTRSFPFIKNRKLYPKGTPPVKIYTSPRNSKLLIKYDPKRLTNTCA